MVLSAEDLVDITVQLKRSYHSAQHNQVKVGVGVFWSEQQFDYGLQWLVWKADVFIACASAYVFRRQLPFSEKSSKTGEKLVSTPDAGTVKLSGNQKLPHSSYE